MPRARSRKQWKNIFPHPAVQVLLALMVFVVAIPLTTKAIMRSGFEQQGSGRIEKSGLGPDLRPTVRAHRTLRRDQRRMYEKMVKLCSASRSTADTKTFCKAYWEAVDRCLSQRNVKTVKVDVSCPDINDPILSKAFKESPEGKQWEEKVAVGRVHRAAPVASKPPSPSLQVRDLSPRVRAALRTYVRKGHCSDHLQRVPIAGFYELCLSLTGEDVSEAPPTVESQLPPMTLEEFLEQEEAYQRQVTKKKTTNDRLGVSGRARPDR